jgi:hypothetical protein
MKKLLTLPLALLFVISLNAQIDVKINPIGLLFANFDVSAEFGLSENFGLDIAPIIDFRTADYGIDEYKYSRFGVVANPRYYVSPKNDVDRFYVGAYAKFLTGKAKLDDLVGWSNTRFAIGANLGYKVVADSGFVFDIGFGIGRAFVNNYEAEELNDFSEDLLELFDIDFIGRLAVGWRF